MEIAERIMTINRKLEMEGETVVSWSKKNGLDHRLVFDLINGKLHGTRGISLNARVKMEDYFGNIFD